MTRREQELIDQHRAWRSQLDAMPEQPWEAKPPEPVAPREMRLEAARARRHDRVSVSTAVVQPHFIDRGGVTLVYGPAPVMEQAWVSGQPIHVRGTNGVLYKISLANITKPDRFGMVVGHPTGSIAERNRLVYLGRVGDSKKPSTRSVRRRGNRGNKRGARSR